MGILQFYCLTNGQLGVLIDVTKTTEGKIDKLIDKLHNTKAGKQNRQNNPALSARYPHCVVIERVTNQYTLRKKGGVIGTTAIVIQFPIKLAFVITSHKIKGQTIPRPMSAALDLESIFEDAQAHVMLSRVQQMDRVFIVENLSESKIRTSKTALEEKRRLANMSINNNPTPWDSIGKHEIKVITINCAGLKAHMDDIKTDDKLLKADVIHVVETSLVVNEENTLEITGYDRHDCSVRNGMGIKTYYEHNLLESKAKYVTSEIQVAKFTSEHLVVINANRSSRGSLVVLKEKIKEMVFDEEKAILLTGAFNICYMSNKKKSSQRGTRTCWVRAIDQRSNSYSRGSYRSFILERWR